MAGRKIRDAADARTSLSAVGQSGLSLAEWSRLHGVDGRSLQAWRLNLARGARDVCESAPMRLVELVPTSQGVGAPTRYLVRCGEMEVVVAQEFEDATLLRLLRVVAAC